VFESIVANELNSFLEIRKALISQKTLKADKTALESFDKYLVSVNYSEKFLCEEVLDAWIRSLKGKSKTTNGKVLIVKNFAKYLSSMGYPSFLPYVPRMKSDYIPYIFSDDELSLLFHYADNLQPRVSSTCSPHLQSKIPMLLRVLYSAGTRLGETLSLRQKDVDFNTHTIFLMEAKCSKERRIPIHETLALMLEKYCLSIGIMYTPEAYLFPGSKTKKDCHFTSRQAERWFSKLLRLAGIDQRAKSWHERGACLHCLRHVFVLKSMQQLEAAGHSVDVNDLVLPSYLGHDCLLDTDKYMKFSGTLVTSSLNAFEAFTSGLIPKVEVPYEDE